jgi:hypothetical protein
VSASAELSSLPGAEPVVTTSPHRRALERAGYALREVAAPPIVVETIPWLSRRIKESDQRAAHWIALREPAPDGARLQE